VYAHRLCQSNVLRRRGIVACCRALDRSGAVAAAATRAPTARGAPVRGACMTSHRNWRARLAAACRATSTFRGRRRPASSWTATQSVGRSQGSRTAVESRGPGLHHPPDARAKGQLRSPTRRRGARPAFAGPGAALVGVDVLHGVVSGSLCERRADRDAASARQSSPAAKMPPGAEHLKFDGLEFHPLRLRRICVRRAVIAKGPLARSTPGSRVRPSSLPGAAPPSSNPPVSHPLQCGAVLRPAGR
jgi:hypothetical protein